MVVSAEIIEKTKNNFVIIRQTLDQKVNKRMQRDIKNSYMIRKIMGDGGEVELVLFSKLSYFVGKSDTVDIA